MSSGVETIHDDPSRTLSLLTPANGLGTNQVEDNSSVFLDLYNNFTVPEVVLNSDKAKLVADQFKLHALAPFNLIGSVFMDTVKPEEKPTLTRLSVPTGAAVELATITKATAFFGLPLAIGIAGQSPTPETILHASLELGGITPLWVLFSACATGFGMKYGHRSRRAVEPTALPKVFKAVSDNNDISEPLTYDRDKNLPKNVAHLGGLALRKGLSSFYVVTPKVYSKVFEGTDDKELFKYNGRLAAWSALGAFTVAAAATSIVAGLHDSAPGMASIAYSQLGSPLNFIAIQFGWSGIKKVPAMAGSLMSKISKTEKVEVKDKLLLAPGQSLSSEAL